MEGCLSTLLARAIISRKTALPMPGTLCILYRGGREDGGIVGYRRVILVELGRLRLSNYADILYLVTAENDIIVNFAGRQYNIVTVIAILRSE